jgi:anti-sigma B factor antagonist
MRSRVPRRDQPLLTVAFAPDETPPVLSAAGELDIGSAPILREALLKLLADEVADVVLDLSGITFVDSSGLAVLLMGARRWDGDDRRLVVRNPSGVVSRVVDLTGVRAAFVFEE